MSQPVHKAFELYQPDFKEIAGTAPWFGTDEQTSGELDFYIHSSLDHKDYGIEVKRGNEIAVTANRLLEKGKLKRIIIYYSNGAAMCHYCCTGS